MKAHRRPPMANWPILAAAESNSTIPRQGQTKLPVVTLGTKTSMQLQPAPCLPVLAFPTINYDTQSTFPLSSGAVHGAAVRPRAAPTAPGARDGRWRGR